MRYGLVQVLNAALTLLSDEDSDIRQKSVEFVCQLKVNKGFNHSSLQQEVQEGNNTKVGRVGAITTLAFLGLDFFEDCAEYFLPITEVSTDLDWTFPQAKGSSQPLFESGDGINVFSETAFTDDIFKKVLLSWIGSRGTKKPLFRFLNCSNIKAKVKSCKALLEEEEVKDGQENFLFGRLAYPKVYTKAVRICYFLEIVTKYPNLVEEDLSSDDVTGLSEFYTLLNSKLFS